MPRMWPEHVTAQVLIGLSGHRLLGRGVRYEYHPLWRLGLVPRGGAGELWSKVVYG